MRRQGSTSTIFSSQAGSVTKVVYFAAGCILLLYTVLVLISPAIPHECNTSHNVTALDYPNVPYGPEMRGRCQWRRHWSQGGLNQFEAELFRRVLVAMVCGTTVGIERSATGANNAALMTRLMTIVTLTGCIITVASMFSYLNTPMNYDASRATAQVPKGVGFLCGAVTWVSRADKMELRGATTSVTVWFAAALGTMAGGGLWIPALFATMLSVTYMYGGLELRKSAKRRAAANGHSPGEWAAPLVVPLLEGSTGAPASKKRAHFYSEPRLADSRVVAALEVEVMDDRSPETARRGLITTEPGLADSRMQLPRL